MGIEVKVPALGESITEATLGAWLKKPGDAVAVDEPVASLETDKVSVDVPSPVAGVFGEALFAEGDTVNVGAVIATIGEGGGAAAAPAAARPAETAAAAAPAPAATHGSEVSDDQAQALRLSPSVRRAVQESGVDPAGLTGSGRDGRLTKEDVAKAKASPAPASAPAAAPARLRLRPPPRASAAKSGSR
jgi:2-oxoglutarate dehydrogenase E2 component (dihydrolipoamide succinyltransferase)